MKKYRRHGLQPLRRRHWEQQIEAERSAFSARIQAELNGQSEPSARPIFRRAADLFGVDAAVELHGRPQQRQRVEAGVGEIATAYMKMQRIPGEVLLPPPDSHEANFFQDAISMPEFIKEKFNPINK